MRCETYNEMPSDIIRRERTCETFRNAGIINMYIYISSLVYSPYMLDTIYFHVFKFFFLWIILELFLFGSVIEKNTAASLLYKF